MLRSPPSWTGGARTIASIRHRWQGYAGKPNDGPGYWQAVFKWDGEETVVTEKTETTDRSETVSGCQGQARLPRGVNALQLSEDTVVAGETTKVMIRGGFPETPATTEVCIKKEGVTMAWATAARVVTENLMAATLWRSVECVVDIPPDADLGLYDIEVTCNDGAGQGVDGYLMDEVVNVIRIALVDELGNDVDHVIVVDASLVNELAAEETSTEAPAGINPPITPGFADIKTYIAVEDATATGDMSVTVVGLDPLGNELDRAEDVTIGSLSGRSEKLLIYHGELTQEARDYFSQYCVLLDPDGVERIQVSRAGVAGARYFDAKGVLPRTKLGPEIVLFKGETHKIEVYYPTVYDKTEVSFGFQTGWNANVQGQSIVALSDAYKGTKKVGKLNMHVFELTLNASVGGLARLNILVNNRPAAVLRVVVTTPCLYGSDPSADQMAYDRGFSIAQYGVKTGVRTTLTEADFPANAGDLIDLMDQKAFTAMLASQKTRPHDVKIVCHGVGDHINIVTGPPPVPTPTPVSAIRQYPVWGDKSTKVESYLKEVCKGQSIRFFTCEFSTGASNLKSLLGGDITAPSKTVYVGPDFDSDKDVQVVDPGQYAAWEAGKTEAQMLQEMLQDMRQMFNSDDWKAFNDGLPSSKDAAGVKKGWKFRQVRFYYGEQKP